MRVKQKKKLESVYRIYLTPEEMDGPQVVNEEEEPMGYGWGSDAVFPPKAFWWETEIEAEQVRERIFNWLLRKYAHNPCEDCPLPPEIKSALTEEERVIVFERLWDWLVCRWREVEQERFLK
jgi:hypothetical protein